MYKNRKFPIQNILTIKSNCNNMYFTNKNDTSIVFIFILIFQIRGEHQNNTMPKVNQEYFENKRKIILNAAMNVFFKKPAYSVKMKDIVKESGLSQGGVYKYYSNIDEIVIALINSNKTEVNPRDIIENYYDEPEKAIFELFDAFRKFFFITAKEFGKIMFELQAMFFNSKERMQKLKDNINKDLVLNYWFLELLIFIDKKIDEKYFNPVIDPQDIYMQMIVAASGIGNELILNKYYNLDRKLYYYKGDEENIYHGEAGRTLDVNLDNLIDTLYKTLLLLLGSKNIHKYSFKN